MNNNFTPEKELVERIVSGDQTAFKEIFYRYKDKLFSYCFRFTKSEEVAEEIVQDVLLKIWTDRKRIDPDLSFSSYLYTITRNYSFNFLKKAAANISLQEKLFYYFDHYHSQPEDQLVFNDLTSIVNKAVALLPPQRRLIYKMSREKAMNYDEIAHHLGISKHTVKNQLVQALKFIRSYLNTHTELNLCLISLLWIIIS
jgi:RNA polymerase sigma-70 factor (ECF subfamily)